MASPAPPRPPSHGLPPGPRSRIPGADYLRLRRDPLGFLDALARDHGDIASWRIGRQAIVFVNHPDLVRDVLVTDARLYHKGRGLERAKLLLGEGLLTSEDEFHLRQRRLAQPAFHRARIASYGATMADYAARTAARWTPGAALDVHDEMMRYTLDVVTKTLFDADVGEQAEAIGSALTEAFEAFNYAMIPFGELLDHLPLPWTIRFRRARARLDAVIYRIVAERRASGEDRGDLLSMLLMANDAEGGSGGMSDEQLRDEAMTLFLAGHETTANALAWTWHLLARHPEVERRLHDELDAALGGRVPSAEDLVRLPYTRAVLSESIRLYPPAWMIGRRAMVDHALGGYRLPARTIVLMSPWVTQRDARWWPDPLRFDPDRWLPGAGGAAERPKFAYFPFGAGTRVCIGEQFAWMEGVLAIATIAQRWRLRAASDAEVVPRPIITLRPRDGIPMIAESRAAAR